MPITQSPLRYPGGKTALAPFLLGVIQKNGLVGADYVEPYAGGAGAALSLLIGEHVDRIWINDADYCVYAFWRSVLDHTDLFLKRIESTEVTVGEWRKQRRIYKRRLFFNC